MQYRKSPIILIFLFITASILFYAPVLKQNLIAFGYGGDGSSISSISAITFFTVPHQLGTAVIDENSHTITLNMPEGSDVTSLIPTIVITGRFVSPASGIARDFTSSQIYTVTAADGSFQVYTVMVNLTPTNEVVELFDIVLTLENPLLINSKELVAWTQFTSFGNVPTTVAMVYRIENTSGEEVYTDEDEITVETERLVTKEFVDLDLPDGEYVLVVTTTYGENVKDEFRQDFEIKGTTTKEGGISLWYWLIGIPVVLGLGGFVITRFIKTKRKEV